MNREQAHINTLANALRVASSHLRLDSSMNDKEALKAIENGLQRHQDYIKEKHQ